MRPSDVVVLPSFWRVAAMKTRGVVEFTSIQNSKFKMPGRNATSSFCIFHFALLLSRQFRVRAGIKFLVIGRLHGDDRRHAENVVRARPA